MMEEKLLHAEFKREVQLQAIVKKAQEEEAKVSLMNLGKLLGSSCSFQWLLHRRELHSGFCSIFIFLLRL